MLDLVHAKYVEVELSKEGVLWINVDGKCVFRSQTVDYLIVNDYTIDRTVTTEEVSELEKGKGNGV